MTKQLSNQSSNKVVATEETNVTGVMSPILTFSPEDGLRLVLQGMVESGSARGFPIYADLNQGDGSDMPEDTELAVQYERPEMDQPQTVTFTLDHIRPWNSLTLEQQQDEETIDRVKVELKNTDSALAKGVMPQLGVRDIDDLHVSVNSSAQIDWSQSRLYIDRNAVQVV